MVLLGLVLEIIGDVDGLVLGAQVGLVLPVVGHHAHQVDHAVEVALSADGQLHDQRLDAQLVLDGVHRVVEVGAQLVHLVDEADAGHAVLVGLTPDGLGLGLHALLAVEHRHSAIEHTQGALHLGGEVHVAGGVDDVDLVAVLRIVGLAVPEGRDGGGGDRDATFLLLVHPVHGGGAVVGLADLVVDAGVVENTLGRRCLAGIDVGHDADVADLGQVREHVLCHNSLFSLSWDYQR